jgi:hypothetical protein
MLVLQLDPKARIALGAVTFALEVSFNRRSNLQAQAEMIVSMQQVVTKQINHDDRIVRLVGAMADLYDFLQDAKPMEKIKSHRKTVERLVQQTAECAYFIAEYSKTEAFGVYFSVSFPVSDLWSHERISFSPTRIEQHHVQSGDVDFCIRSIAFRTQS